jgi:uncharacterized membrane protein
MGTDSQHPSEPSMTALISGLISDAKALLQQELLLAKHEIRDELDKTKKAVISLGTGIGIAVLGVILLSFMLVYLLGALTHLPLWACYGIVGGAFAILGGVLLYTGKSKAAEIDVVPQQTVETMKENAAWIRQKTTSGKV